MNDDRRKSTDLPPAAVEALAKGRKIDAIKILREERRIGLKEAKESVEYYLDSQPALQRKISAVQAEAARGFFVWVLVILALLLGGYYFLAGG